MLKSLKHTLFFTFSLLGKFVAKGAQPTIFDTDYGSFIDDVFALGLLVNSADLIDLKLVITTAENPELSAKCVAKHLDLSGKSDVPTAIGSKLPPYAERGSVCAIEGLIGFALESECLDVDLPLIDNGVEYMANMILESGLDDWWYIAVGGQTSLKSLIENYPEAASKIDTLIIMGGNWCSDFEPYPDVMAPTDETNIGCDPAAANYVLDGNNNQFTNVYFVPVVVADEIGGEDYSRIVEAANSGESASAAATLEFYKKWSEAGRADANLLIHLEAMTYDPEMESTPQFDACAIMLALELLGDDDACEDRLSVFEFNAVHFLEAGDDGLAAFPAGPRSAFSLHGGGQDFELPEQCPALTVHTFDEAETPEAEYPVKVALGFTSAEAKAAFYSDMATRMAGDIPSCTRTTSALGDSDAPTNAPALVSAVLDDSDAPTGAPALVSVLESDASDTPTDAPATMDLDQPSSTLGVDSDAPTMDDSGGTFVLLRTALNAMTLVVATVMIL
jgi:inosine-uridine nucleoside N-ribohydrolase